MVETQIKTANQMIELHLTIGWIWMISGLRLRMTKELQLD